MNPTQNFSLSRLANILSGLFLALLWAIFAYIHFKAYQHTGDSVLLFLIATELMTIIFYLTRHDPKSVSINKADWLFAFVGTFAPLLFAPSDFGLVPQAKNLMYIGIAMQILGLLSLNRSFALVAAQRDIKTGKMYGFVRHPIYASYLITFTVYVLVNTTTLNILIYIIFLCSMLLRIIREERHLSQDRSYRHYMNRVRYRLIPFVF